MASKYWLKLYHEVLDDPKVMTLKPRLRWRFIETLLVAGEMHEDGYLPPTDKYAWRVRDNLEIVETELNALSDAGLLSRDDGRWVVTKFAERQAPVGAADRMRRMRERKRKRKYYGDDTQPKRKRDEPVTNRNTDIDKDTDTDSAREHPAWKLPDVLDTEDFEDAWILFYRHRIDIDEPLTQASGEVILQDLAQLGEKRAIAAIKHSVAKGWKGIYESDTERVNVGRNGGAEQAWQVVSEASKNGSTGAQRIKDNPKIMDTVNELGGWPRFKNCRTNDWPFLKRDFIKAYRRKHGKQQRT